MYLIAIMVFMQVKGCVVDCVATISYSLVCVRMRLGAICM